MDIASLIFSPTFLATIIRMTTPLLFALSLIHICRDLIQGVSASM